MEQVTDNIIVNPTPKPKRKRIKRVYSIEQKEQSFLKFLNLILNKLNKDQINAVTDFKNINRNDIINIDIEDCHDDWYDILFPTYSKTKFRYASRHDSNSYFMSVIRRCCKEINKECKTVYRNIIKNCIMHNYTIVSIC